MKTLRIFLASSAELTKDRKEFEIFIGRKNKGLIKKGLFLELNLWEDFIDALSQTRLQDKYNQAVINCDIFVMLFFTKVGKYTEEEFVTAFGQFKATNKPLIYTYFKDSEIRTGSVDESDMMSVWDFKKKLEDLRHFYTTCENIDNLKYQFDVQLDKLLANTLDPSGRVIPTIITKNSGEVPKDVESVSKQQGTPKKLIIRLEEQLQLPELREVISDFIDKLVENCPDLQREPRSVAEFLVTGQGQGDNRRIVILQFLQVAEKYVKDRTRLEPLYDLLAYLLQTLVSHCEGEVNGLTRLPVNRKQTVELINATKKTNPLVPGYGEENLEFKNGKRNSRLENIGDFQPPTGAMDDEMVCQEIAKGLLKKLGDPDKNPLDALDTLTGRLSFFDVDQGKLPLQGILIHEDIFAQHPFNVPSIVKRFNEMTENRLPIYIYGTKEGAETKDWLHTKEEKIRALVLDGNKIVENYHAIHQKKTNPIDDSSMESKIKVGDIGSGATVTIGDVNLKNSQMGQGNIQFRNEDIAQLQQLVEKIRHTAAQADDVGKQEYAEITQATNAIKTEILKSQGADKNVLTKAKEVLKGFKDVASIAGSIDKITQLLLPLIG